MQVDFKFAITEAVTIDRVDVDGHVFSVCVSENGVKRVGVRYKNLQGTVFHDWYDESVVSARAE